MAKKLSSLLAAITMLVFAAPAMASAAESRLTESGTPLPIGSTIVTTGTEVTLTSNLLGAIRCKKLTLRGTVTKNEPNNVQASGENVAPAAEDCTNGTKILIVTKLNIIGLASTGSGKGTFSFIATIDIGEIECTLTGEKVPFTYTSGTSVLLFSKAGPIKGSPAACGTNTLDAEFKLETENGTAVVLD